MYLEILVHFAAFAFRDSVIIGTMTSILSKIVLIPVHNKRDCIESSEPDGPSTPKIMQPLAVPFDENSNTGFLLVRPFSVECHKIELGYIHRTRSPGVTVTEVKVIKASTDYETRLRIKNVSQCFAAKYNLCLYY